MLQNNILSRARSPWIWAVMLIVIAGASYWAYRAYFAAPGDTAQQAGGKGFRGSGRGDARNVPVVTVAAKTGDIGVYLNGLGSVTPLNTVTVKTRIDGQLMKVLFREGQLVRAGEVLAEIDPRTYQAQLLQAEGQMARDTALLKNAQLDLERYRVLYQQDSIAKQQLDTQQSLAHQYEGTVKVDQAAIDTARLQLNYCRITAPVSGRLGLRQVDPGNMVHAGDATGLVVITQLQPITVIFTIPEDNVPGVMKKLKDREKLTVEAWDRAEKERLATGTLLTADNQIDPATGTVKLKAQFGNDDFALFPNQFVNTHMLLETRRDATLIPTAAIQRGTPGTFVYVLKPDNTVSVRVIKLGPTLADRAAVESGVAPGELVVVDGADKLREGATVQQATRDNQSGAKEGGKGKGGGRKKGGDAPGSAPAAGPAAPPANGKGQAPPAAAQPSPGAAGGESLTLEERKKRWEELNARIDRGDFGEEIKKLPEEERKKKMRELRSKRQ